MARGTREIGGQMSPCGRGGRRSKYWASSQREVSESERERKREKERQRERDTWEIDRRRGRRKSEEGCARSASPVQLPSSFFKHKPI